MRKHLMIITNHNYLKMSKIKSVTELKDERALKEGKFEARKKEIITAIEVEQRGQTDSEKQELETMIADIRKLDIEITEAEARGKSPVIKSHTKKTGGNLIIEALRGIVSGNMSEEAAAFVAQGQADMRNVGVETEGNLIIPMNYRGNYIQATVADDGKETIAEDLQNLAGPLKDRLVMVQAGAHFLTGLKGNVGLPFYSGSTASWAGEVDDATNGKGTFDKITLSPKRLTTFIDISKQFLAQDTVNAQPLLISDVTNAIAIELERAILGKHATATTKPDGFFTGKDYDTDFATTGAASYAGVIDMETAIDTANALQGNLAYITTAKGKGALRKALRAAGVAEGFVLENSNSLNGYKFLSTNAVASGFGTDTNEEGIIFGNWADYVIGQWGGLDITVDPYTQAGKGVVRLVINAYFDATQRRADSFAIGSIK